MNRFIEESFSPSLLSRNRHIQTTFASLGVRAAGKNEMVAAAEETIVPAGDGVRLLGYYSRQPAGKTCGTIILLHGWEGSSNSTYMLTTGRFFYRMGYDVFRLNLRDHGNSHCLNEGIFHGALTKETLAAIGEIAAMQPDLPCCLIGFSLGGNFALRVALNQSDRPIPNLKKVFAVSPAIDPYKATLAIDNGPAIYRRYFMAKWKRSLKIKQQCFPSLYNFDSLFQHTHLLPMTEAVMAWYPQFADYRQYFNLYTLTGDALSHLSMPVFIFMAEDDPAVPVEDFYTLPPNPFLHLSIQRHGGHCGFLAPFPFGCWYERQIAAIIQAKVQT